MFEDQTFNSIINRTLSRVPNNIDKREGSIIYDSLAPQSLELELYYKALERILIEVFPDTASREFLLKHANSYNITPKPATHAVVEATLIMEPEVKIVPNGTRFSKGDLNFTVIEYKSGTSYLLQCEQAGEVGNEIFGLIQPIVFISGLQHAEITGLAIPGTDIESTESLRDRFRERFGEAPFGGNMADYKQKVHSLQGVGGCKIMRHFEEKDFWVGVIVIDSTWHAPSEEQISKLQEALHPILPEYTEPVITNSGDGLAPIGHVVKVQGVREEKINIELHLTFSGVFNFEAQRDKIIEAIRVHLEERYAQQWEDLDKMIIRISGIENAVLGVEGVIDIQNTKLNGKMENITLESDQIPVLGDVTNV